MGFPRKYAITQPGTGWRERLLDFKAKYANRNLDEVHKEIEDTVYAMALDGASLPVIAAYFGVGTAEFRALYQEVHAAGHAELQAIICADTVEYGLNSQIPVAKIWLGKAIGGLGETKSVDVEGDDSDSGDVTLNIKVIRREPVTTSPVDAHGIEDKAE